MDLTMVVVADRLNSSKLLLIIVMTIDAVHAKRDGETPAAEPLMLIRKAA